MFNINFTYLIMNLIPPILRRTKQVAWLQVITSYLLIIYNAYIVYRNQTVQYQNFTGQVIYLEKRLNDYFDTFGIFISDGEILEQNYIYNFVEDALPDTLFNFSENKPDYFLFNGKEYDTSPDFIVNIRSNFYNQMTETKINEMINLINYYLVFGKKFIINPY